VWQQKILAGKQYLGGQFGYAQISEDRKIICVGPVSQIWRTVSTIALNYD